MKRLPLVTLSVFLAFSVLGSREARAIGPYSLPPHDATEVCFDSDFAKVPCAEDQRWTGFVRIQDIMEAARKTAQNAGPPAALPKPPGPPHDFATSVLIGATYIVPSVEATPLGSHTAGGEFGLRIHFDQLVADIAIGGQGSGAMVEARVGHSIPVYPALRVIGGIALRQRYPWMDGQEKALSIGAEYGVGHDKPFEMLLGAAYDYSPGVKGMTPNETGFENTPLDREYVGGIRASIRFAFKYGGLKHGERRKKPAAQPQGAEK
jgi:hypothetical protein